MQANEPAPAGVTVAMSGEVDIAREGELIELIMAADPPPGATVDVDFGEVTFIDSAGLRGVLNARSYLEGRGCGLRVVHAGPQSLKLFAITGLTELLGVDPPTERPPAG